jgi:hypothetical protein
MTISKGAGEGGKFLRACGTGNRPKWGKIAETAAPPSGILVMSENRRGMRFCCGDSVACVEEQTHRGRGDQAIDPE